MYRHITVVSHWLPVVTRCPLSILPDLVYVRVTFEGFAEIYSVRRRIFKELWWRRAYMEDLAQTLIEHMPSAKQVEVRLLFNRHQAIVTRVQ